jgi:hypothetical protein
MSRSNTAKVHNHGSICSELKFMAARHATNKALHAAIQSPSQIQMESERCECKASSRKKIDNVAPQQISIIGL